jgi:hypothetical protein
MVLQSCGTAGDGDGRAKDGGLASEPTRFHLVFSMRACLFIPTNIVVASLPCRPIQLLQRPRRRTAISGQCTRLSLSNSSINQIFFAQPFFLAGPKPVLLRSAPPFPALKTELQNRFHQAQKKTLCRPPQGLLESSHGKHR